MTHRHAMRRGVAPRPGERDLRELRRLIRRAARIGADPLINAKPFVIAAERAGKAILPAGHSHDASPFVQLIRIGKRFLVINAGDRIFLGPRVAELAVACGAVLEPGAEAQPRLPYRED